MKKFEMVGTLLVAGLLASLAAPASTGIAWEPSIPRALETAAAGEKPVLVDVWAVWCAPCKLMEEKVWPDPGVRERAERFVTLKVDADANEVFTARYDAEVLPATLFLDGEGRLITRLTGYVAPEMLRQVMDAVTSGYGEYLELAGRKNGPADMDRLAAYYRDCGNPFEAAAVLKKAIKKAKKDAPESLPGLELTLAETLLLTDRPEQGAKSLERLAAGGGDQATRTRAQEALAQYRAGLE